MWKIVLAIVISVCIVKCLVYTDNDTASTAESVTEPIPDDGEYERKCNCRTYLTTISLNQNVTSQQSIAIYSSRVRNITPPLFKAPYLRCCGERNEASRIVGGVETAVNEFPWVARLSYHNKFYCGSSLINDRFVLTAAHCVKTFMWFMIKVTLGEHDRCNHTHRPMTHFVVQVMSKDFSFANFNDDIALLRLNSIVQVTDTVMPVCLPKNDDKAYAGVNAVAAGWGTIGEGKNHSCYLQEVEVPVLSNKACKEGKYSEKMITDTMLCAGFINEGKKDTCQGDSGGPLSAERRDKRHEQLGVVSWGIGCGRVGYPGVYTRVTKYLTWIRNVAKSGCFCTD